MRKQRFLSIGLIIMLFFSACTKDDVQSNYTPTPVENNSGTPFVVSYSYWTDDASLNWADGATADPSRQFDLALPELTEGELSAGSFVLLYAKSNIDGSIQALPAAFADQSTNESHIYSANYVAGTASLLHTKSVNGSYEMPGDANGISFRYIVVRPNTPDPNGRVMTIYDLLQKPYQEVISLLAIPE